MTRTPSAAGRCAAGTPAAAGCWGTATAEVLPSAREDTSAQQLRASQEQEKINALPGLLQNILSCDSEITALHRQSTGI